MESLHRAPWWHRERMACSPSAAAEMRGVLSDVLRPSHSQECRLHSLGVMLADLQDRAHVKQLLPWWTPGLRFAAQVALVNNANQITKHLVARLPQRYVMKGTHGSSMLLVVHRERATLRACSGCIKAGPRVANGRVSHAAFLAFWCAQFLNVSYGRLSGEPSYDFVHRKCLFEESLADDSGRLPDDVKVFTYHGKALLVLHTTARYTNGSRFILLDTTGQIFPGAMPPHTRSYRAACADEGPPPRFDTGRYAEMVRHAELLASRTYQKHHVMRVDFFANRTHTSFAELTPTPGACSLRFQPPTLDKLLAHASRPASSKSAITGACLHETLRQSCPLSVESRQANQLASCALPAATCMAALIEGSEVPSCCTKAAFGAARDVLQHSYTNSTTSTPCRPHWPQATCACHRAHNTAGRRYALPQLWDCLVGPVQSRSPSGAVHIRPPTNASTVLVFTSFSPLSATSTELVRRVVQTSLYPVFFFHDEGNDPMRAVRDRKALEAVGATHIELDLPALEELFGGHAKLFNFGGRTGTLRHFGIAMWLVRSAFRYAWVIETDVFVRDAAELLVPYERHTEDFLAQMHPGRPGYFPWRCGDVAHSISPPARFGVVSAFVMRWSYTFASALLKTLVVEEFTSHHEIFFPFVVHAWHLSSRMLHSADMHHLAINGVGPDWGRFTLEEAEAKSDLRIAHPVKRSKDTRDVAHPFNLRQRSRPTPGSEGNRDAARLRASRATGGLPRPGIRHARPRALSTAVDAKTLRDCKYVYVDLGSSIGLQIKKLYQPSLCPQAPVQQVFSRHFPAERRGVCTLAVEPNPEHTDILRSLRDLYVASGSHVQILEAAAAVEEGSAAFYFNSHRAQGSVHHHWGGSLEEMDKSGMSAHVATIDIASLLRSALTNNATVVMKVDIEQSAGGKQRRPYHCPCVEPLGPALGRAYGHCRTENEPFSI